MTSLVTPIGKVTFSQLEEARSFKDQVVDDKGNQVPKKFSISVEFEGEDAKKLRLQLMELNKAVKIVDGKLKITFSSAERLGKPRLVGKDKKDMVERPRFLPKGTEVRVMFTAREYPMGVSLLLEAVMVVGDFTAEPSKGGNTVILDNSAIIDKEFLDVF